VAFADFAVFLETQLPKPGTTKIWNLEFGNLEIWLKPVLECPGRRSLKTICDLEKVVTVTVMAITVTV
jgi:hypothetical protein